MPFDYKKEYKEFYLPKAKPGIVTIPKMSFAAIRGEGDPNIEDGDYKKAVGILYAIAYTIKMSKMGSRKIKGYFDYVVPPLEGFWQQKGNNSINYSRKDLFQWTSVIRLPEFVSQKDFEWAKEEASRKKGLETSRAEFWSFEEGLCIQCMHLGYYDDEPATIELMHLFMEEQGYRLDINDKRLHHEIYLSDPRKTVPEKLKTVIRHPIRIDNE